MRYDGSTATMRENVSGVLSRTNGTTGGGCTHGVNTRQPGASTIRDPTCSQRSLTAIESGTNAATDIELDGNRIPSDAIDDNR